MNKIIAFLFCIFGASYAGKNQPESQRVTSTRDLVTIMLSEQSLSTLSYTFIQETIQYDTLGDPRDTSTWYESVQYPDKFRIDLGSPNSGDMALYKGDSLYRYKANILDTTYYSPRDFLFLESRFLQYSNTDSVLARLSTLGFDVNLFYKSKMGDYVIGAEPNDFNKKQVWLSKDFYITRSITPISRGRILDMQYGKFKLVGNLWVESEIAIYIDSKLRQMEYYREIKTDVSFGNDFFNPTHPFDWHWATK